VTREWIQLLCCCGFASFINNPCAADACWGHLPIATVFTNTTQPLTHTQSVLTRRRLLGTSADRHCCHKHHTTHLHTHKLFLTRRRLLGTSADRHCVHKHHTTHLHTHKLFLTRHPATFYQPCAADACWGHLPIATVFTNTTPPLTHTQTVFDPPTLVGDICRSPLLPQTHLHTQTATFYL
jgi:hypothetical protein